MNNPKLKLDNSRLLGYRLISINHAKRSAGLGAKVGAKPGTKLGAKVGTKPL